MRGSRHHGYGQIEGHRKKPAGGCGETTNWKKILKILLCSPEKDGISESLLWKKSSQSMDYRKTWFQIAQKVQRINKINEIKHQHY
jgi:hypothetical protein